MSIAPAFCCLKQDVQDLQDFQDVGHLCNQPPLVCCLHFGEAARVKNAVKVRKDLNVYRTLDKKEC